AAAGFAALLPMRLATAASVSNDTLAEAVFTAALLLMLRMIREGASVRRAAGLGVTLGVGVLTKSGDMLLFPVALVALLFASRSHRANADLRVGGSRASSVTARQPADADRKAGGTTPNADRRVGATTDTVRFLRCAAVTFSVALLIGGGWMIRN